MKYLLSFLLLLYGTVYGQCLSSDTCTNNTATVINSTTVTLSTTPPDNPAYEGVTLVYVRVGFTDSIIATGSELPINVGGLRAGYTYKYYFRASCSNGPIYQTVYSTFRLSLAYTPMTAAGYEIKNGKFDEGLALPNTDSVVGRQVNRPGLILYKTNTGLITYNGEYFEEQATRQDLADSMKGVYYNKGVVRDTTIGGRAGIAIYDTTTGGGAGVNIYNSNGAVSTSTARKVFIPETSSLRFGSKDLTTGDSSYFQIDKSETRIRNFSVNGSERNFSIDNTEATTNVTNASGTVNVALQVDTTDGVSLVEFGTVKTGIKYENYDSTQWQYNTLVTKSYVDAHSVGGAYIPITGTDGTSGPVTGDIRYKVPNGFIWEGLNSADKTVSGLYQSEDDNENYLFITAPNDTTVNASYTATGFILNANDNKVNLSRTANSLEVSNQSIVAFKGLVGRDYYGANYDSLTYVQKKYVDDQIASGGTGPWIVTGDDITNTNTGNTNITGNNIALNAVDVISLEAGLAGLNGLDSVAIVTPGPLRIDIPSKGATKVLTSDANGYATWQIPAAPATVNMKFGEEFTGSTSTTLTLANSATVNTVRLFKNGVRLLASGFSVTGATITLTSARLSADVYQADYNY